MAEKQDIRYWRSLDELAAAPDFEEMLHREFPREASVLDAMGRRSFLKFMGASLALAGLAGCGADSPSHIVPYVKQPEQLVPGKPLYFSSATTFNGYAMGTVVESNMGRPTKVEGNPSHPASLGASDIFAQASILSLYDPERSQSVLERSQASSWDRAAAALDEILAAEAPRQGAGLRIVTETITSPTLARLLNRFLQQFPKAKVHQYQPMNRDNERRAAIAVFGEDVNTVYHFDKAAVIVTLDADFLSDGPGKLRYARDFMSRRRVRESAGEKSMNRLYAFECTPTLAGSMADHRWPLRAGQIEEFARQLAVLLGAHENVAQTVSASAPKLDVPENWISALVNDLKQHRGESLIIPGPHQPPALHALAHVINHTLDNIGKTITFTEPVEELPADHLASIRELTDDLNAGTVSALITLGGDPVYTAPADLNFEAAFQKAAVRIHQGLYSNATSFLSQWHIPQAHELECWCDARAFDGTVSIVQPLILPLYNGRSMLELAARLSGENTKSSYEFVRETWREIFPKPDEFEHAWRTALSDGIVKDSQRREKSVSIKGVVESALTVAKTEGLEINFRPDPTIWDGRYVNNGWLQELPKPLSKLTWDNAVLLSPATAQRLGVENDDLVELEFDGRSVRGPVFVSPGHANDAVTVHLGYGQEHAGRVGKDAGFNAYALRTTKALAFASGAVIRKTGEHRELACTQGHFNMESRKLIQETSLSEFQKNPELLRGAEKKQEPPSLYPGYTYPGYAWGMVVDIGACIGCNACILGCQAENNIPVVGRDQVAKGREMHWLRVDRYFSGDAGNPASSFQPVPCMQCENAPCELVCPVGATAHSAEGLNDMVYNRCIGTRYCSNNCPYKVRRFNFFQYSEMDDPSARMRANPEVTVRERGVMEKCTYCVQRITRARIDAEKENRPVRDGEVLPACAQACPTEAIVFGDINTADSRVAKLKSNPLNYALLEELNTRPRTTYLARVRNPNPEIV